MRGGGGREGEGERGREGGRERERENKNPTVHYIHSLSIHVFTIFFILYTLTCYGFQYCVATLDIHVFK